MYFNGEKLPLKDFQSYLSQFDIVTSSVAFKWIDEWWEVNVEVSANQSFQQISFVNSISTTKGGGHVSHIADQVAKQLIVECSMLP